MAIFLPMTGTVLSIRAFHHLLGVHHVYISGHIVRHLFSGVLLLIPSAFVVAFGTPYRWLAILIRMTIGISSGMILDEIVFLIVTQGGDNDYLSGISLGGSAAFIFLATLMLWILSVVFENKNS